MEKTQPFPSVGEGKRLAMDAIKNHYSEWEIDPTKIRIAFQGRSGSFSEQALIDFFGEDAQRIAHNNFQEACQSLITQECDFGILPIENTIMGTVHPSFDVLGKSSQLQVIADHTLRIEHALIGFEDTDLNKVTTIFSQAPGLAQCEEFLSQYRTWERIPWVDTAAAVQHVAEMKDTRAVAIASERASSVYGLSVLQKNIETDTHNYTRFVVIVNKNSDFFHRWNAFVRNHHIYANVGIAVFTTADKPGSLFRGLQQLEKHNINLHKIESRPIIGKPWEYQITIEMELRQEVEKSVLKDLESVTQELHVIGWYHRINTE